LQGGGIIREEVMPTSPAIDPRVDRQVEAEVRVGEQEYPDGVAHAEK
jgi:hypothetical protein